LAKENMNDDTPIHEPERIRQDAARKLRAVQISGHFQAILDCLLGEELTTPRLLEMMILPKGHMVGRSEGQPGLLDLVGC